MDINEIIKLLEEVMNDRGVPKNIKASLEESINTLKKNDPEEERLAAVISILDEASNDTNISSRTRTQIWNIVSVLEGNKK